LIYVNLFTILCVYYPTFLSSLLRIITEIPFYNRRNNLKLFQLTYSIKLLHAFCKFQGKIADLDKGEYGCQLGFFSQLVRP